MRSAVVRGRGSVSFGAALSWGSTSWIHVGSAIMGLSWAVGSVAWRIGWRPAHCRRSVGWASTWSARLIAWGASGGILEAVGCSYTVGCVWRSLCTSTCSSSVSTRSSRSSEVARCSSWSHHPASTWRPIARRCCRSGVSSCGWRIASSLSWACGSCLCHAAAWEARGING